MSYQDRIETYNYYNDSRVCAASEAQDRREREKFDRRAMTITCWVPDEEDPDNTEHEVTFPAKMEVCGTCGGKGTHTNPSVDCGGISGDDWYQWDEEEREMYMSGGYDVTCYDCQGENVTPTIDEGRCTPEQKGHLKALEKRRRQDAEFRAIQRAEMAMGA